MSMTSMVEFLQVAHRLEVTDVLLRRTQFIEDLYKIIEIAEELIEEYE